MSITQSFNQLGIDITKSLKGTADATPILSPRFSVANDRQHQQQMTSSHYGAIPPHPMMLGIPS